MSDSSVDKSKYIKLNLFPILVFDMFVLLVGFLFVFVLDFLIKLVNLERFFKQPFA